MIFGNRLENDYTASKLIRTHFERGEASLNFCFVIALIFELGSLTRAVLVVTESEILPCQRTFDEQMHKNEKVNFMTNLKGKTKRKN